METWEMMLKIWGTTAFISHCEMSAFKYRQRIGTKPEQSVEQDLEKALWYENKARELRGHSCKYVKRIGESCTLNNNCKYPNCEQYNTN